MLCKFAEGIYEQRYNRHGAAARSEVARNAFYTFSFYMSVKAR